MHRSRGDYFRCMFTCGHRAAHTGVAVDAMTSWMALPAHLVAPYPTAEQRRELAAVGGITERQVTYWFSNARKREWKVRVHAVGRVCARNLPNPCIVEV